MTTTFHGGITCPGCGEAGRNVVESRRMPDRVRRRCACSHCGERFTTWEFRHDQINASVHRLAADRAARLLDKLQGLEHAVSTLRRQFESELNVAEVMDAPDPSTPASCDRCVHWEADRCDLGHPDPLEEGIGFARWCVSFQKVTA